jgi:hypothetical protein
MLHELAVVRTLCCRRAGRHQQGIQSGWLMRDMHRLTSFDRVFSMLVILACSIPLSTSPLLEVAKQSCSMIQKPALMHSTPMHTENTVKPGANSIGVGTPVTGCFRESALIPRKCCKQSTPQHSKERISDGVSSYKVLPYSAESVQEGRCKQHAVANIPLSILSQRQLRCWRTTAVLS